MKYLTLDLIKKHLNMLYDTDTTDVYTGDDTYLTYIGEAVEDSTERYIDTRFETLAEDGELPKGLIHAMLLMVGHYYSNREALSYGVNVQEVPLAYDYLTAIYRDYKGSYK